MSLERREELIALINEARENGAKLASACEAVEIDCETYRRWQVNGEVIADRRAYADRAEPQHKLSQEEREIILLTCNLPEFKSLSPS